MIEIMNILLTPQMFVAIVFGCCIFAILLKSTIAIGRLNKSSFKYNGAEVIDYGDDFHYK